LPVTSQQITPFQNEPRPQPDSSDLNYESADRRAVAIVQAWSLIESRMRAALAGIDIGLEFVSGNELDQASSQQIRADMIGHLIPDDRYWAAIEA
jgi:hypothetical protein